MMLTVHDPSQRNSKPDFRADTRVLIENLTGFSGIADQRHMRGFSLRLADGSCWWIASSPAAAFSMEKIAAIMQLREGDLGDNHILFFYEKEDYRSLEHSQLQVQGWINLYPSDFQIFFHPKLHHALCGYDTSLDEPHHYLLMSFAVHVIHWKSIYLGGLPFHAALLEHQRGGVLLAARSGTGKSTCSRRVSPPWLARCDDEVLVVLSPEGRYVAHPFPTWTDYLWKRAENTWKVEEALPLAGIFFLEQSLEDECVPLRGVQAAAAVTRSADEIMSSYFMGNSNEVRELRRNIFINACDLLKQIPAFRLRVSLNGRFWDKIETALR